MNDYILDTDPIDVPLTSSERQWITETCREVLSMDGLSESGRLWWNRLLHKTM